MAVENRFYGHYSSSGEGLETRQWNGMQISVKHNIGKVISDFQGIAGRHLPFAIAKALTETGKNVATALEKETHTAFDMPTRFIQQAFGRTMVRKGESSVKVFVKDWQQKILEPHIFGGDRYLKRFEEHLRIKGILPADMYVVPGEGARLNRFGNMSGGQITQILFDLKAWADQRQAMLSQGRMRSKNWKPKSQIPKNLQYFVLRPGDHPKLPPGVWMMKGRNRIEIKPVLIFAKRPFRYSKRFKFFEVGEAVAVKEFEKNFREALEYALKTAR